MAKKTPTNTDLARIVHDGFKVVHKRLDGIETEVGTFHDFMLVQKDREGRSNGTINLPADVIKIITWLIVIIGALVGITKLP